MEVLLSSFLLSSVNQKQAWIRLMINALETNFFYYQSDPCFIFPIVSSLALVNNRFQKVLSLEASAKRNMNLNSMGPTRNLFTSTLNASGRHPTKGMMQMNFPSISGAFKGEETTSNTLPMLDSEYYSMSYYNDPSDSKNGMNE